MRDCERKVRKTGNQAKWESDRNVASLRGSVGSQPVRCALRALCSMAVAAMVVVPSPIALSQEVDDLPGLEFDAAEPGAPYTEVGGGDFFSQELGTLFRIRYNTQSYGQEGHGNLDLGTMRVQNFEDAIGFFDGQVTLNDVQGVGYNLGLGFRWLHWVPFPLEPERITGLSLWTDGTSTESGNFFPQIGLSYESLGDAWDFRANSYIPLGKESQLGAFEPTGEIDFQGHFLSQITVADRHTSFNVGEIEIARRLGMERDAWAFGGGYALANSDEDTAGYRVGLRGYAYPDLLLQIAVSDDDIFKTNAAFSLIWFVGRTRTDFQPACGLPDRMREPVLRNDYVTLARTTEVGGIPLTDDEGNPFRFVHVYSEAPAGGDGTFENPFNEISDPNGAGSQEDDIILLWADSQFNNNSGLVLKDRQRLLGEGDGMEFTIDTLQEGVFVIPETRPGARDLPRPIIFEAMGDAVTLADENEVANIEFQGNGVTARAIAAPVGGAGNPNLHDLEISETTGDAIFFTPIAIVDGSTTTIKSNVTIDDLVFDDIGGHDINIVGTTQDVTAPGVTLQEVINISDVTTTDGNDFSLTVSNTHSGAGRTTTVSNYNYNGGATGGGFQLIDFDGTFNASNSTLRNGTLAGLQIAGESDGTFSLASTVTFDSVDGTVIEIGPNMADEFTGNLTVAGAITNNDTGGLVSIQRVADNAVLNFTGAMTDVADAGSQGIFIGNNTDGQITFTGVLTVDTTNNTAIELLTNADTEINFDGRLVINADGAGANGFDATDGGVLTVTNTTNTITTDGGIGLRISDVEIGADQARFADVNVTGGATNGIFLADNTGAAITVGTVTDSAGDAGTIEDTTGDAVVIENSANVSITGLRINNSNAVSGVRVTQTDPADSIVNLSDLEINDGDQGIEIVGGGAAAGDLTMTINDSNVNDPTAFGLFVSDVDNGSITINDLVIDGDVANPGAQGVHIENSNATITVDAASMVTNFAAAEFFVDGGTPAITMNGDITNPTGGGESIHIEDIAGGNVTFGSTSAVNDDGGGIRVLNNTGGTINFNGTYDLDTTTNTAVLLDNNDNTNINFNPGNTAGNFDIDTTTGEGFVATGGGNLTVTGTANTITSTGATGLRLEEMTIGAVDFESVNASGGTNGIRLVNNLTGTITVGDAGNAVGAGGTISGTSDVGVVITNSNVTLNGVTVTNAGGASDNAVEVTHTNSTTMTANFNRLTVNNNAVGQNGVEVDGSGGSGTFNANFQNLDLNANGNGLNVHDGVTLTAGGTNTIDVVDGVGLTITDSIIAAAGANFQSVNVTSGNTNGIVIQDVTGGQVQVGTVGGAPNSGGSLTTVGDAIVLTNVQNVDLRDIRVVNASGAGSKALNIDHTSAGTTVMDVTLDGINVVAANAEGIDLVADNDAFGFNLRITDTAITSANVVMDITGAATFAMVATNLDITTDVGGTDRAFDLQFHGDATDGDVTIRGDSRFIADDGEALFVDSFDNTAKDIKILVEDSEFTDTLGTEIAAVFQSRGNTLMQLTVQGNEFTSAGAARDFVARSSNTAAARMRLNLGGDATEPDDFNSALGQGTFLVDQVGTSIFGIFERDDTLNDLRNNQPVDSSGTFQDLATPPDLPTIP